MLSPVTTLLDALLSIKPREIAGSRTANRYEFQAHVAILNALELHRTGKEFCMLLDFLDDLAILDSIDTATRVHLYQIKTLAKGSWRPKMLIQRRKGGKGSYSIVGKMFFIVGVLGPFVEGVTFISKADFSVRLADGSMSSPDHRTIRSRELYDEDLRSIMTAVRDELNDAVPDASACLFSLERTSLGLNDQPTFVVGRVAEILDEMRFTCNTSVRAVYQTLYQTTVAAFGLVIDGPANVGLLTRKSPKRSIWWLSSREDQATFFE